MNAWGVGRPRLWASLELLPAVWRAQLGRGVIRTFNPTLVALPTGYALAYRVVLPDGLRRLALCRLTTDLDVVPGSTLPLSDLLGPMDAAACSQQACTWFADPRLVRWGDQLLLHWNSGCHAPRNHQFVQALDPVSLMPTGRPRELLRIGGQFRIEKNWGLLASGGELWAVYSLCPLRLLRLRNDTGAAWEFAETDCFGWDDNGYGALYGEMRGGAPPQRVGDRVFVFGHSRYATRAGIRYVAALAVFEVAETLRPFTCLPRPLPLPHPHGGSFLAPRLNDSVRSVVYPGGALHEGATWLVAYGLNDEHCAVVRLNHQQLLRRCVAAGLAPSRAECLWDQAVVAPPPRWRHWLRLMGWR